MEKTIFEINKNHDINFDIILDDGSHIVEHMILSFNTLFKYVKPGGFYIIEDIKKNDLDIFTKMDFLGGELYKIHEGNSDWDSMIIIKK